MTQDDIKAIMERANAATKGPWHSHCFTRSCGGECSDVDCIALIKTSGEAHPFPSWVAECSDCLKQEDNATFIANARQDIPALCDEVERLRARVKELEDAEERRAMDDAGENI